MDMNRLLTKWVEKNYFQNPSALGHLLTILFLPLTLIYCIYISLKRANAKPLDFGIKIISIGNIVIGGSGKTPVVLEIAKTFKHPAVILRGYGRKTKGLFMASQKGKILNDVQIVGDEATLLAQNLKNASVIVSEDRKIAILKAKELGCDVVVLDDGFGKFDIKKFDILIRPKDEPKNLFCIPSGPYRFPKFFYTLADLVLQDGVDFHRIVTLKKNNYDIKAPTNLVAITAIAKPFRLKEFLPQNSIIESFADHHNFTDEEIEAIFVKYPNANFATTAKDLVKLSKFADKFILINLEIHFAKPFSFPA